MKNKISFWDHVKYALLVLALLVLAIIGGLALLAILNGAR